MMETERSQARRFWRVGGGHVQGETIIERSEGGRTGRRYHRAKRSLGPDSERLW